MLMRYREKCAKQQFFGCKWYLFYNLEKYWIIYVQIGHKIRFLANLRGIWLDSRTKNLKNTLRAHIWAHLFFLQLRRVVTENAPRIPGDTFNVFPNKETIREYNEQEINRL